MDEKRRVRVSKFLSKVLRHAPGEVGLTLDEHGWVSIQALIAALAGAGLVVDRAEIDEVVRTNDKQRFAIDGDRIRANQGHTVDIDLALEPVIPPDVLFHGTVADAVPAILTDGLRAMRRNHVHLSADTHTATKVGARRGKPVILRIDAAGAHAAGTVFYRSENGVWLADAVPAAFIGRP